MTITRNIHIGLSAWQVTHVYASVGTRVSHSGNAYQLTVAGTSGSTGPTGTGSSISDGSCTWKWLSAADYSSLSAWAAGWAIDGGTGGLTDNVVGLVWNNGVITTTVGTPFISVENFVSDATHTITLKCAPGESFRDTMAAGTTTPLAYNAANGVSFQCPSGTGSVVYFKLNNHYCNIDGFQFLSPDPASASSVVGLGQNSTCTNCLFDAYSQTGSAILGNQGGLLANCVFYERGSNTFESTTSSFQGLTNIVNCTFVALTPSGNIATYTSSATSGANVIKNCIAIGYTGTPVGNSSGSGCTYAVDHCLFSNATNGWMAANANTDGGGNLYGKTAANQFVSATTDFRLKSTADALNAGTTDTTDIPAADDIAKTHRPQNTNWDIGAFELILSTAASALVTLFTKSASASAQQRVLASTAVSIFVKTASGTATEQDLASAAISVLPLTPVIAVQQQDYASATVSVLASTAVGAAQQSKVVSATLTAFALTASCQAIQGQAASAVISFFNRTIVAAGQIPNGASASITVQPLVTIVTGMIPIAASALLNFNLIPNIFANREHDPYPAAGSGRLLQLSGFGTVGTIWQFSGANTALNLSTSSYLSGIGGVVAHAAINILFPPPIINLPIANTTNAGVLYNYIVSWSTSSNGPWTQFGSQIQTVSEVVTGLTTNTPYWFQVIPVDNNTTLQGPPNVVGPVMTL